MSYALPFAGGIAAALVNIAITWRLPVKKAAEFYNLFMAATATVYIGSALSAETQTRWSWKRRSRPRCLPWRWQDSGERSSLPPWPFWRTERGTCCTSPREWEPTPESIFRWCALLTTG